MKYIFIFLLAIVTFLPVQADAVWFSSSWNYKVKVEVNPNKVGTTTAVTSMPVYNDCGGFPTTFWTNASSTGADIRVVESDDTTETAFELVSFSTTSKSCELHFMADSLGTTSTSTFYVYYGNATATAYAVTDTYGRNAVWSDYRLVMHGNAITDSSGSITPTQTGVVSNYTTQSKIGSSYDIPSQNTTYNITSNITGRTVSAWVRLEGTGNPYFGDARTGLTNGYFYWYHVDKSLNFGGGFTSVYKDTAAVTSGAATQYVQNTWYHIVAKTAATWTDTDFKIGNRYGSPVAADIWDGQFDEIRVTDTIDLSTATILTEYNNQSATSTFFYIGAEETSATSSPSTGGIDDFWDD